MVLFTAVFLVLRSVTRTLQTLKYFPDKSSPHITSPTPDNYNAVSALKCGAEISEIVLIKSLSPFYKRAKRSPGRCDILKKSQVFPTRVFRKLVQGLT